MKRRYFGTDGVRGKVGETPIAPELTRTIDSMSPGQVRGAYILYIGAGAVAACDS